MASKTPPTLRPYLLLTILILMTAHCLGNDYTPGEQHNYTLEELPEGHYQYSVWVPKNYDKSREYAVLFYLHGGGRGRHHPNEGKRNMISQRLKDNQNWTDAGYSGNAHGQYGYIHVAPVKPIARWNAKKFKQLLNHVVSKVSIDEDRVYVTGFSMGGQGTWHVGCGSDLGYKIAAMIPLGAWGCNEVKRGKTPETCNTTKTPVWVMHCPYDNVSKISEQIPLFKNHLKSGGYGRFTMIPGKGHISRPRGNDDEGLSMRVAWMLSQSYGTPFNYVIQTNGGVILEAVKGERSFIGDTSRYGFFEPGTEVSITAPATRDNKPFVRWVALNGTFSNPKSRRTTYKTTQNDSELFPIYETNSAKLTVIGGISEPKNPSPGDIVTVTANKDEDLRKKDFLFWSTDPPIKITQPYNRSVKFCLPSTDIKVTAKPHL
ncbi:hypothetical protein OAF65_07595 [Verrucomicrobiales bacterium]|nr:hypothetical protein [Verrucomicrobiales bacterium]